MLIHFVQSKIHQLHKGSFPISDLNSLLSFLLANNRRSEILDKMYQKIL